MWTNPSRVTVRGCLFRFRCRGRRRRNGREPERTEPPTARGRWRGATPQAPAPSRWRRSAPERQELRARAQAPESVNRLGGRGSRLGRHIDHNRFRRRRQARARARTEPESQAAAQLPPRSRRCSGLLVQIFRSHKTTGIGRRFDFQPAVLFADILDGRALVQPANNAVVLSGAAPQIHSFDPHSVRLRVNKIGVHPNRCVGGQCQCGTIGPGSLART